jgi:glycosyltransferase involved in cell wall biosynthesis
VRLAHAVVCVSTAVAQYAHELGADPDRVHAIPNGVDTGRFQQARQAIEQRSAQSDSGRSERTNRRADPFYVVGFVGTLRPWHGMSILGRAFQELRRSIRQVKLLVVGDGPARAELLSELDQETANAVTITGHVHHDHVADWMSRMDVAVAPYPQTGSFYFSPLKIMEYMAAGLPVVASRLGDIPMMIEHQENGLLVEPGNIEQFAASLMRLYRDQELRRRLGRHAAETVGHRHTWERVVDRTLALVPACPAMPTATPMARSAG